MKFAKAVSWIAGVCVIALIVSGFFTKVLPKDEIQKPPSYAGFTETKPDRNYFLLVGDTQKTSHWEFWRERNDKERKFFADEMARRNPAFVVFLGDLTTRGSSEKHWKEFDDLHKTWREKNIPCFPLIGNHELYGDNSVALQNYFERFPHLEKKRWYSFTWKKIGFIMIDSNFPNLTQEQIKEQSQWYLNELEKFEKNSGIDSIIVCCHYSPFTNNRVIRPSQEAKIYFADPFLRFRKTRLFFSGHSHAYERFEKDGKVFIVSGGGGGPRHKLTVDPAKRPYPDQFNGPEIRFFHFCEIETSGKDLRLKVIRLEQDGSFTIADSLKL